LRRADLVVAGTGLDYTEGDCRFQIDDFGLKPCA